MPGWVRKGDKNNVGAPVISAVANSVIVNGRPAALKGSVIQPHPKNHRPTIAQGASTVIAEGRPAAFNGAKETCGHSQAEASGDVFIPGG